MHLLNDSAGESEEGSRTTIHLEKELGNVDFEVRPSPVIGEFSVASSWIAISGLQTETNGKRRL
jgi:hypothetical protein